ncbi:MAG: hypothetical protein NVS9B14_03340 [Candidatus Acidiferrum sp.]
MTCCVVAVCDDGKTIVMIADRMIGIGIIESEPNISKLRELHKDWWVLFSGDNISSIFDIVDYAKEQIREIKKSEDSDPESPISLQIATKVVEDSYQRKRMNDAETLYLRPIGWDIGTFNATGKDCLPDFIDIKGNIDAYSLPIELLVAGFSEGKACLFSLSGSGTEKGITQRHDIPGFYSVGGGGLGALYMLYYREMSSQKPMREAVYYTMEAKLLGASWWSWCENRCLCCHGRRKIHQVG